MNTSFASNSLGHNNSASLIRSGFSTSRAVSRLGTVLAKNAIYGLAAIGSMFSSTAAAVEPVRNNEQPAPLISKSSAPDATLTSLQVESRRSINPFVGLPHIQQPNFKVDCGPTSVLMAFQVCSGLRLQPSDVRLLSNVISQEAGEGLSGSRPSKVLPLLGLPTSTRGFNLDKLQDKSRLIPVAEKSIVEYVIPALEKGHCVLMTVASELGAHVIVLVDYDASKQEFKVNDPGDTGQKSIALVDLVNKWPCKYQPHQPYQLQAYVIEKPQQDLDSAGCTRPEVSKQIKVDPKFKSLVAIHPDMIVSNLCTLTPDIVWTDVAKHWEKGRNPQEATGLALLVKLQIAQGKPVFLSHCLSVGKRGMSVAVAHGYEGDYNDVNQPITVSGDFTGNGTLTTRRMTTQELISFCTIDAPNRTYLSIGFVKPQGPLQQLVSAASDASSLASAPTTLPNQP